MHLLTQNDFYTSFVSASNDMRAQLRCINQWLIAEKDHPDTHVRFPDVRSLLSSTSQTHQALGMLDEVHLQIDESGDIEQVFWEFFPYIDVACEKSPRFKELFVAGLESAIAHWEQLLPRQLKDGLSGESVDEDDFNTIADMLGLRTDLEHMLRCIELNHLYGFLLWLDPKPFRDRLSATDDGLRELMKRYPPRPVYRGVGSDSSMWWWPHDHKIDMNSKYK